MAVSRTNYAEDYKMLAQAIDWCSLEEMELYLHRTTWKGDELIAIEEAVVHLQMLWSIHITRVLTGCLVSKRTQMWLLEPLYQMARKTEGR